MFFLLVTILDVVKGFDLSGVVSENSTDFWSYNFIEHHFIIANGSYYMRCVLFVDFVCDAHIDGEGIAILASYFDWYLRLAFYSLTSLFLGCVADLYLADVNHSNFISFCIEVVFTFGQRSVPDTSLALFYEPLFGDDYIANVAFYDGDIACLDICNRNDFDFKQFCVDWVCSRLEDCKLRSFITAALAEKVLGVLHLVGVFPLSRVNSVRWKAFTIIGFEQANIALFYNDHRLFFYIIFPRPQPELPAGS